MSIVFNEEDGSVGGADNIVGSVVIDLSDLDLEAPEEYEGFQVVAIELEKVSPEEGNLFGFWPHCRNLDNDEIVVDDFHTSLWDLCDEYEVPLDIVIGRICLALLARSAINS